MRAWDLYKDGKTSLNGILPCSGSMDTSMPAATAYVRKWHNRLWFKSEFSTICKVDYITNNLVGCFNNCIKHHKSLNLDDFFDKARQLIMILWSQRRKVAKKLDGLILPPHN
jgi:hypothetical protein